MKRLGHCSPVWGGHSPACDRDGTYCSEVSTHEGPCKPHGTPRDFGREAYLSIADELSGDPDFLQEADPAYVEAARAFALGLGLPYPPTPDVDLALDEVRNRERNPR